MNLRAEGPDFGRACAAAKWRIRATDRARDATRPVRDSAASGDKVEQEGVHFYTIGGSCGNAKQKTEQREAEA